jgi:hypothetical protein
VLAAVKNLDVPPLYSPLEDARAERLSQNIALGYSVYDAARAAGYADVTARAHGKRLVEKGGIAARVAGLVIQQYQRKIGRKRDALVIATNRMNASIGPVARAALGTYAEFVEFLETHPQIAQNVKSFKRSAREVWEDGKKTTRSGEDFVSQLEMHNQMEGLDRLAKMLGWYVPVQGLLTVAPGKEMVPTEARPKSVEAWEKMCGKDLAKVTVLEGEAVEE